MFELVENSKLVTVGVVVRVIRDLAETGYSVKQRVQGLTI